MSQVLLTSDAHLGCRNNSEIYLNTYVRNNRDFVIPLIKEYDIEEHHELGDDWDNRNVINTKVASIYIQEHDYYSKQCPKVKRKKGTGNHDCYYKNTRKINSIESFLAGRYKNLEIITELKEFKVGSASFIFAPWFVTNEEASEFFKHKADVALGHFAIRDFELVPGIIDKEGLLPDWFRKSFKLTFSGHYHIRREYDGIVMVGNPYQMTWNDYNNEKGAYILDTETLEYKFIPNTLAPKYVKIMLSRFDECKREDIENNFLKLYVDVETKDSELIKINDKIISWKPLSFNVEEILNAKVDYSGLDVALNDPIHDLYQYIENRKDNYDKNKLFSIIQELQREINLQ